MTINLQTGGGYVSQPLPGARRADIQVGQKTVSQEPVLPQAEVAQPEAASIEQDRYQRVLQAAKDFVGNYYAVSDKSFAIYKDASGQFITRYTNLRDGRVTYIPEPQMLQASAGGRGAPVLSIQA